MNASSLAVIFAPNLLRPAKEPSAMQALEEVKHRTVVIQSIIESTIKKYVSTLAKINSLDDVSFCKLVRGCSSPTPPTPGLSDSESRGGG